MTIGIAAYGDRAGFAILEGLKAAEAVGKGALHGFVSLVAIGQDGHLHRAEVQNGGIGALQAAGGLTPLLLDATRAGLMSSGPNRPAPLEQFTPADPHVGLVTGHRFPNAPDRQGTPLNVAVLDLMRGGSAPHEAVSAVVADNAAADAGFIALSIDGRLHAMDAPYLQGFGDAGQALEHESDGSGGAAVLHNAIHPHRAIALLVLDVVLSVVRPPPERTMSITMQAGTPLRWGHESAIDIDSDGVALCLTVRDPRHLVGPWSLGLGYRAVVRRRGERIGTARYEPYLRANDGILVTIDGNAVAALPVALSGRNEP